MKSLNLQRTTNNLLLINGFSLIELLVSIAVILILVGISFAGYTRLTIKQNLTSAGLTMKNVIRDTQSRAFNREVDCTLCSCDPDSGSSFAGWVLDFANMRIYGLCGSSTFFSINSFSLPKDIVIRRTSDTILFNAINYSINPASTICLSNSNVAGNYYIITLNSAGVIEEKTDTTCPF